MAELEREREAERAASKERSRLMRLAQPPSPVYWKQPSEEIRRQQVEAEYAKWCKSKGVTPGELTDEDRVRFFGTF